MLIIVAAIYCMLTYMVGAKLFDLVKYFDACGIILWLLSPVSVPVVVLSLWLKI